MDGRPALVIPHANDDEPPNADAYLAQANADAARQDGFDAGDAETTGIRGENIPEPGRNVFDRPDAGADVKSKSEENVKQEALPMTTKEVIAAAGGGGDVGVLGVAAPVVGGTSAERKDDLVKEKDVMDEGMETTTHAAGVEKEKPVDVKLPGEAENEVKNAAEGFHTEEIRR